MPEAGLRRDDKKNDTHSKALDIFIKYISIATSEAFFRPLGLSKRLLFLSILDPDYY